MENRIAGCHECDLIQRMPPVPPRALAQCGRCGALLYRNRPGGLERALAWTATGIILYIIANVFPFLVFQMKGQTLSLTLVGGTLAMYDNGMILLSGLVFFTSVCAPGLLLATMAAALGPLWMGWTPPWVAPLLRLLPKLRPWVMVDVFILSILVAVVKLAAMASVAPGAGAWGLAALMFALSAALSNLDLGALWRGIAPDTPAAGAQVICHDCGQLNPRDRKDGRLRRTCRRCGAPLHRRKPESLQRTWALVIAALLCYLPANLLPVMISGYGGWYRSDTIMEGVVYMLLYDSWVLAAVIFVASILVPLTKILILLCLLISVRLGSRRAMADRMRLYRITEVIGKWSMVDIFVVTIMTGLVQLGNWGTVRPGPGALYFGAVVVLTMAAAMTFDPRLIWDAADENHARSG